jgi:hypothetical protein
MPKELVDLVKLLEKISEIIGSESGKQTSISELCNKNLSDCERNICVTIHFKYMKRLFSFQFGIEKAITIFRDKEIKGLEDNAHKEDVLDHYVIHSRFDFFIGIFSLFEDFISSIVKSTLPPGEYTALKKQNVSIILNHHEIARLIEENYPVEYGKIKAQESFIPLPRKIDKLVCLDAKEKEDIKFFSIIRNSMHNNGFYHGNEKEFKDFGVVFKDNEIILTSMQGVIVWSERIFELTNKLASYYVRECILDKTVG